MLSPTSFAATSTDPAGTPGRNGTRRRAGRVGTSSMGVARSGQKKEGPYRRPAVRALLVR
ncbi:hypothetical protein GCM10010207_10510 [Streptomyces atratus]|nr:hypothetical protein GCM10010207_10510 [Streptomyces atratus]